MSLKEKEPLVSMRLDKWLWCARFYKTRALAVSAIKGNKIKVNDSPTKASRHISIGDHIKIRQPPYQHTITVLQLSPNRRAAGKAVLMYAETAASINARAELARQIRAERASFPGTRGRPGKRDRRHIIRFTRKTLNDERE